MNNLDCSFKLFDKVSYAVSAFSSDGNILFWNKASESLFGWTEAEALNNNIFSLTLHESDKADINTINESLKNDVSIIIEHILKNKSGESFSVRSDYSPVYDAKNDSHCIIRIDNHFSGNKTLEDELKKTKENFELFFNTIDEYLFVLDGYGNIIHVNKSVIERLGYSEDELIGKSVLFVHPENRRDEAGITVDKMLKNEAKSCFVPLQAKNGELISVETYVSKGEWNGVPAVFGVSKDITLLKQSEEKFSKTFHNNIAAMAVTSIEDNKFIEVNDAFLELMEYKREEVIGKTANGINAFNDPSKREIAMQEIHNKGFFRNIEVGIITKNKVNKVGLFSGEIFYIGKESLLLTECVDITAIRESEKIIKESEENLRILNSEKDKFFSIIAHDLKSPFTALLGFSDLMVKGIDKFSISQFKEMSDKLNSSAQKLYSLLSNLLEWSLLQRNLSKLIPVSFSIRQCIEDSVATEKHLLNQKEINLDIQFESDIYVMADLRMIESTVRNLLTNAVKFTNRKGNINISVKEINDVVTVCIRDNGIGMTEEMVKGLFELSSNVQRTGTEKEPSSGLGLLLCKDFIQKNHGKIWVESEQDKGSSFFFTLNKA